MDAMALAETDRALAEARAFIRTATHEQVRHVRKLIDELEAVCVRLYPWKLSNFIDGLMLLSNEYRTDLSRDGALRCRRALNGDYHSSDEADWTDPETGQRYLHPTIRTYALAIHYHCMFAPPGAQILSANWNDATVGDIVTCALGHAYRNPTDEVSTIFRNHLEGVVFKVIALENAFAGPRESRLWAATVDALRVIFLAHPDSPMRPPELARIFPSSSLGVEKE